MTFVDAEERALWAAAAVRVLPKIIEYNIVQGAQPSENVAMVVAAYVDSIVLEYRKRDGSRP
jgi:hypothetical protein